MSKRSRRKNKNGTRKAIDKGIRRQSQQVRLVAKENWLSIQTLKNHWMAVATLVSLGLAVLMYIYYERDKKLEATSGVIYSPNSGQIRYLSVGATRFLVDSPDGVLLRDGDDPVLSMRASNGRLLVAAKIRDQQGMLVAELVDNEWKLNKDNYFDRNYTQQALEVRDRSGRVALQVAHFGDTVHLAGAFVCKNGWSNVMGPIGNEGAVMDIKPPGRSPEYSIPPIFEYPSDLHFGSAPGLDEIKRLIRHGPGPAYRMGGSLDICKKPHPQGDAK